MANQIQYQDITFHVGDIVRVYYKIIEKEKTAGKTKRSVVEKVKERIQPFEGAVIAISGSKENKSFTVRRIAHHGIGVERVFPVCSPWIKRIEVKQRGKVRRAKLYYFRKRGNLDIKFIREENNKKKKISPKKKIQDETKSTKKKVSKKTNRLPRRTSGRRVSKAKRISDS